MSRKWVENREGSLGYPGGRDTRVYQRQSGVQILGWVRSRLSLSSLQWVNKISTRLVCAWELKAGVSLRTDHLKGISAHAPHHPRLRYMVIFLRSLNRRNFWLVEIYLRVKLTERKRRNAYTPGTPTLCVGGLEGPKPDCCEVPTPGLALAVSGRK
ncbi:hypothetical protein TNCV_327881 [Trichonephila clavipes]|nr:hypothetical protein TNCV_327881 [Trichonephila clavipes]